MKKLLFCAGIALSVILAGCNGKKSAQDAAASKADSLKTALSQKGAQVDSMMATMTQIQDGFNAINAAEGRVNTVANGENANKSQQLKDDIKFIVSTMKSNKDLIAKLQNQLKNSKSTNAHMNKMVASIVQQLKNKDAQLQQMREELDKKDIHIMELDENINNLNTNVSNLKTESTQKSNTINAQEKQLNTAWYAIGTKKDLKDEGILMGSKLLQSNFNENYFTKIDIRVEKVIKLHSSSAKILTTHASSSYTLTQDGNSQYVLTITNPQIFWSTSKYLVIKVK